MRRGFRFDGERREKSADAVVRTVPSPVGALILVEDILGRLHSIDWEERKVAVTERLAKGGAAITESCDRESHNTRQLLAYFSGVFAALSGIEIVLLGTPFQMGVWNALRKIPAGATSSYGQVATALGQPGAARAVGLANGANPIPIVVPCHRVIGANGSLTGFGGGTERKRWLLAHERRAADPPEPRQRELALL